MTEHVLASQQKLQDRAHTLIERLRLDYLFSTYGDYYLTGSAAYGTMVRRDLDFKLKLREHSSTTLFDLARELFDTEGIYVVHVHNITGFRDMEGFVIKVSLTDIYAEKWNIEIMIEKTRFEQDKQFNHNMQQVSDLHREIILRLKQEIFGDASKDYRDLSPMIYKAVVENRVTNMDEFVAYLDSHGKKIADFSKSN